MSETNPTTSEKQTDLERREALFRQLLEEAAPDHEWPKPIAWIVAHASEFFVPPDEISPVPSPAAQPVARDLPGEGHWTRAEGEWDVLVKPYDEVSWIVCGFHGPNPIRTLFTKDTGLPRGGWLPAQPTAPVPAGQAIDRRLEGKTPWDFACDWYKPDEIHRSLNARHDFEWQLPPDDTTGHKFAEWMAHQYRLAMRKGIELGFSAYEGKLDEIMGLVPSDMRQHSMGVVDCVKRLRDAWERLLNENHLMRHGHKEADASACKLALAAARADVEQLRQHISLRVRMDER
jgi:hypothetical protein